MQNPNALMYFIELEVKYLYWRFSGAQILFRMQSETEEQTFFRLSGPTVFCRRRTV